jgi:hypothetical protein
MRATCEKILHNFIKVSAENFKYVNMVFWTLSIVCISIKLQHFRSWIFFRLHVKEGRTKTPAVGPPG